MVFYMPSLITPSWGLAGPFFTLGYRRGEEQERREKRWYSIFEE